VTGDPTPVLRLGEHDLIHIGPHLVDGLVVGLRETDAEVVAVIVNLGHVVIEWQGNPRFLGGSPDVTGATVYMPDQRVLRFGRAA
jgi:hypothetical protein